jgi:hypothetical protein
VLPRKRLRVLPVARGDAAELAAERVRDGLRVEVGYHADPDDAETKGR